jgi:hypothetical protein
VCGETRPHGSEGGGRRQRRLPTRQPPSPTAETPRYSPAPDRRVRARGSLSPRGPQGGAWRRSPVVPSLITSPGQEQDRRRPPLRRSGDRSRQVPHVDRRAGSRGSASLRDSATSTTGTRRPLMSEPAALREPGQGPAPLGRGGDDASRPGGTHRSRSGAGPRAGMAGRRLDRSRALSLRHRYVTGYGS